MEIDRSIYLWPQIKLIGFSTLGIVKKLRCFGWGNTVSDFHGKPFIYFCICESFSHSLVSENTFISLLPAVRRSINTTLVEINGAGETVWW